MSFLGRHSSLSFGGLDEDFTGREIICQASGGEECGTAVLCELIASAGFSQIYKAFYTGDNGETRIVAAKVLTTGITHTAARAEPVLKRLYDRELAALSAVKHKHVIELVAVGEVNTVPDSPEREQAVLSRLATQTGIGDLTAPSTPGTNTIEGPGRYHSLVACSLASRMDSYSAAGPFAPFHNRPLQSNPSVGANRFTANTLHDSTEGSLLQQGSVNIRTSPSLPSISRTLAGPGTGQGSTASHSQHLPGLPNDSTNFLTGSLSGQVDSIDMASVSSQQGPNSGHGQPLPQIPIPGSVLSKHSYSRRHSFLSRLQTHRPMPSLTFSTRRSINSVPGGGPGATRRVLFIQWMSGGDARTLVDQAMRPMDESAAASIVLPVLQALEAAHSQGIVHRDVKAGNILLAPGPRQVRLADWGISVHEAESCARVSSSGGQVRAPGAVGTEYWCAPEIELGQAHDSKSDLFSLAITFIELVTGRDPRYDNSAEGFKTLLEPSVGLVPDFLSQECLSWLLPCLSLNPSERPSAAGLLAHPYFVSTLQRMESEEEAMQMAQEEEGMSEGGAGAHRAEDVASSTGSPLKGEQSMPIPAGVHATPDKARGRTDSLANVSLHGRSQPPSLGNVASLVGSSGDLREKLGRGGAGSSKMSNKDFAFPKTHMANTSASMLTVQGPGPAKGGQGGTHTEDPAIAAALGPAPYLVEEPHTSTRTPLCGCRIS